MPTTLAVGTEKGGYLLRGGGDRWDVDGPLFPGWKVTAWARTTDATLAALASGWFGVSIHRTTDDSLKDGWEQVPGTPSYDEASGLTLNQIWTIQSWGDRLVAGADEAGLFLSEDDGRSWKPLDAFNTTRDRDTWNPGAGGLCAHHVLSDGDRLWVGVSAVGVFRSDDGGVSFRRYDDGVTPAVEPGDFPGEVEVAPGWCVHGLAHDPARPDHLWRQDHKGVYRSRDGGDHWERIEDGLPGNAFGFPIVRDHASGRLFVVPLEADANRIPVDGRFRVYRSDDDGDSWQESGTGFPDHPSYTSVLRNAADVDGEGTVAIGTTSGDVWISEDAGDGWTRVPATLPRILAVRIMEDG